MFHHLVHPDIEVFVDLGQDRERTDRLILVKTTNANNSIRSNNSSNISIFPQNFKQYKEIASLQASNANNEGKGIRLNNLVNNNKILVVEV